jgi:hypothetical protein
MHGADLCGICGVRVHLRSRDMVSSERGALFQAQPQDTNHSRNGDQATYDRGQ